MKYVRLGQSDLQISRIGFGCAAMSGYYYGKVQDDESVAAVHRALELGVNFFDTADVYGLGHAEEVLSKALGKRRSDVIIATKFGVRWNEQGETTRDVSAQWAEQAVEGSLRRLKLDCIPLFQIHWPDGKTPLPETLNALEKCRQNGKIRHIGCCNFSLQMVEEAQAHCRIESLQVPFSLAQRDYETAIGVAHDKHQMAVLAYNVLAQGLFSGKYERESRFEGTDLRQKSALFQGQNFEANLTILDKLRAASERHGRTPSQAAIAWTLHQPAVACALTGIKKPRQIEDNAQAADWNLSAEELDSLGN